MQLREHLFENSLGALVQGIALIVAQLRLFII